MNSGKHLVITGRVQGVGYRAFVQRWAQDLKLDGWVRNRSDGTVEVEVFGETIALESLIDACRRGPPGATVTEIVENQITGASVAAGSGFAVKPTL